MKSGLFGNFFRHELPGAASGRNQKMLNNRDTNYTNFHEFLSDYEERLAQLRQNIKT